MTPSHSDRVTTKRNGLYFVLAGLLLTNALLAEILGAKLFSLEGTLGLDPVELWFLEEGPFSFTLTAGVLMWPVVFVTTDIINEYFGPTGVKRISYLVTGLIIYAFIVIYGITLLTPSPAWVANYPGLRIHESFNAIFRQGLGIIAGSVIAFLLGQLVDAYVFDALKRTHKKWLWLRATGSTLVSQLIDSFVVLFVAFYLFNTYPLSLVLAISGINYIYKFIVAVLLTPVIYGAHWLIDRYLGSDGVSTA